MNDPFMIAQRNEIDFTIHYERENVRWDDDFKKDLQSDTKHCCCVDSTSALVVYSCNSLAVLTSCSVISQPY